MPAQPSFTLGIEEEFQVVDPETRELRSHISEMFAEGEKRLKDEIKREMHEAVIEVGTPICTDVEHARREVTRLRREIINLCRESGLRIAASGTHPISHWASVPITSNERYDQIVYDLQMVARANLIFGLHVHVAIEDLETRIQVMNAARYFLPHVFALSVNSPFWCGQNTGWKSYRAKVFERFPRTGIPDSFRSNSEFEEYVQFLIKTNSIDNAKKSGWDMRPHSRRSNTASATSPCASRRPSASPRFSRPSRTNSGRCIAATWDGASIAACCSMRTKRAPRASAFRES